MIHRSLGLRARQRLKKSEYELRQKQSNLGHAYMSFVLGLGHSNSHHTRSGRYNAVTHWFKLSSYCTLLTPDPLLLCTRAHIFTSQVESLKDSYWPTLVWGMSEFLQIQNFMVSLRLIIKMTTSADRLWVYNVRNVDNVWLWTLEDYTWWNRKVR